MYVNIFMKWFKLFYKYIFYFSGCECDLNVHNSVVRMILLFRTLLTVLNIDF